MNGPSCPYGYTMCQISRHDKSTDCWVVAHRRVYDATKFLESHPAGPTPILNRGGKDATQDYDFHSAVAQKLYWKPLYIGRVVACPLNDRDTSFSSSCTIQ